MGSSHSSCSVDALSAPPRARRFRPGAFSSPVRREVSGGGGDGGDEVNGVRRFTALMSCEMVELAESLAPAAPASSSEELAGSVFVANLKSSERNSCHIRGVFRPPLGVTLALPPPLPSPSPLLPPLLPPLSPSLANEELFERLLVDRVGYDELGVDRRECSGDGISTDEEDDDGGVRPPERSRDDAGGFSSHARNSRNVGLSVETLPSTAPLVVVVDPGESRMRLSSLFVSSLPAVSRDQEAKDGGRERRAAEQVAYTQQRPSTQQHAHN